MPQNVYKRLAQSKTAVGKSLSDVKHIGKMGEYDVADVATKAETKQNWIKGAAYLKNMMDITKRVEEKEDEAKEWADKQRYEETEEDTGFAEYERYDDPDREAWEPKKLEWKDTHGEVLNVGDILARKEEKLARQRKGLETPLPKQKGLLTDDELKGIQGQYKSKEKFISKLTGGGVNFADAVEKYGTDYKIDDKNKLYEYHQYDYTGMLQNVDKILQGFKDNKVVDKVIDGDSWITDYVSGEGLIK